MFLGGKCIVRETNEHFTCVVYSWPGRMHIYPAGPYSRRSWAWLSFEQPLCKYRELWILLRHKNCKWNNAVENLSFYNTVFGGKNSKHQKIQHRLLASRSEFLQSSPLKPFRHHTRMVPRGSSLILNCAPSCFQAAASLAAEFVQAAA